MGCRLVLFWLMLASFAGCATDDSYRSPYERSLTISEPSSPTAEQRKRQRELLERELNDPTR
jgi:hypothetical protein